MFDIGFWELAIIGIVALVVVGPERLPGLIRTAGHWSGKIRQMASSVKSDLQHEIDKVETLQEKLKEQEEMLARHNILIKDSLSMSAKNKQQDQADVTSSSVTATDDNSNNSNADSRALPDEKHSTHSNDSAIQQKSPVNEKTG